MRVVAVLLTLAADLAWNLAGSFWGFTLLAVLVLWVALNQAHMTASSKAYATEQRLNAAMARIPNPQTTPGSSGNTSYPISSGVNGIGSSTSSVTANGGSPAHTHAMNHTHYYGDLATDFNALRDTCSNLVSAHNGLVTKLQDANILT